MKIKNLILVIFILVISITNVSAKTIEDEILRLEISEIYVEIINEDSSADADSVVFFKEIIDYTYNPVIKKVTNKNMSNNDITVINLNLDFKIDIKELIKSKINNCTDCNGRLVVQYKIKSKTDKFKSIYNINRHFIDACESGMEYDGSKINKLDFNSVIPEIFYRAYFIFDGDELKLDEGSNPDNYILLSQNMSQNLELTVEDRIYYIYDDMDDDSNEIYEDSIFIWQDSLVFISVQGDEGKATIKGLSLYSNNSICEIYRSEENVDNYIYVGDIKCDGKSTFIDNVEPGVYAYKLKDKNIGIFSKEEDAYLTEDGGYIPLFGSQNDGDTVFLLILILLLMAFPGVFAVVLLKIEKNIKSVKNKKK